MNYKECYEWGKEKLAEAGIEEAGLDARLLLESVCRTKAGDLLAHGDAAVSKDREEAYAKRILRRAQRIPLQHITGAQEFMGLEFLVNDRVLIPRPDTEILVEEVMRHLTDQSRILDLCTGSGCILFSLLHYSNGCAGVGADLSSDALAVAEANRKRLGVEGAELIQSDLFEAVEGKFDFIVSNPPYIASGKIGDLMEEVRLHEPVMALDGGEDGLLFYRRILEEGPAYLKRGGGMFLEIGYDQGTAVRELMERAGFCEIEVVQDYAGQDRVVCGLWY